ncbi:hypothetical protein H920_06733 [Fukomys damarensis]|uniref:Uncharacterized protein n=1 Tax=Fukomys damarensis TaxID=885580 RepID=A0A091DL81_FUKDA|nr:hypothetical protein H920_06733 [Fukomys damarensis]
MLRFSKPQSLAETVRLRSIHTSKRIMTREAAPEPRSVHLPSAKAALGHSGCKDLECVARHPEPDSLFGERLRAVFRVMQCPSSRSTVKSFAADGGSSHTLRLAAHPDVAHGLLMNSPGRPCGDGGRDFRSPTLPERGWGPSGTCGLGGLVAPISLALLSWALAWTQRAQCGPSPSLSLLAGPCSFSCGKNLFLFQAGSGPAHTRPEGSDQDSLDVHGAVVRELERQLQEAVGLVAGLWGPPEARGPSNSSTVACVPFVASVLMPTPIHWKVTGAEVRGLGHVHAAGPEWPAVSLCIGAAQPGRGRCEAAVPKVGMVVAGLLEERCQPLAYWLVLPECHQQVSAAANAPCGAQAQPATSRKRLLQDDSVQGSLVNSSGTFTLGLRGKAEHHEGGGRETLVAKEPRESRGGASSSEDARQTLCPSSGDEMHSKLAPGGGEEGVPSRPFLSMDGHSSPSSSGRLQASAGACQKLLTREGASTVQQELRFPRNPEPRAKASYSPTGQEAGGTAPPQRLVSANQNQNHSRYGNSTLVPCVTTLG